MRARKPLKLGWPLLICCCVMFGALIAVSQEALPSSQKLTFAIAGGAAMGLVLIVAQKINQPKK